MPCAHGLKGEGMSAPAMPKNKLQGIAFGILMSITMVFGMEIYNVAWRLGLPAQAGGFANLTNEALLSALMDTSFVWIVAFIFSGLWGNPFSERMTVKLVNPHRDSPLLVIAAHGATSVLIMCPLISLFATVVFGIALGDVPATSIFSTWLGTVISNFPMALMWNFFFAGPVSRWIFARFLSNLGESRVSEPAELSTA